MVALKKVRFSIILPTYNRAHMISRAIESVINQTHENWELIIIDDGSTDNTEEVVKNFINNDSRIKYLYQVNAERSAARNKGISLAKGEYICFLDSDDLFHTSHLETFYDLILQNDSKIALYVCGVSFGKYDMEDQRYDISHKNHVEFVLLNTIGTPRACIHRSILSKINFDSKLTIGEDRELWSRIALLFPVFTHKKKTFIELDHSGRSIKNATALINLQTTKQIIKTAGVDISSKVKNKIISDAYYQVAKEMITKGFFFLSIKWILLTLISDSRHNQFKYRFNILLALITFHRKKAYSLVSQTY